MAFGMRLMKTYPFQDAAIMRFLKYRFNINRWSRQVGKSTVVRAFILWYAMFHQDKLVAMLANKLMLAKEEVFTAVARTFEADKVLVVCDRGALDNRAYMTDEDFRYVQEKLGMSEVELRDHYDAVFHLVTAAKGAEEFYTYANNAARYETVQEAVESDDRLIAAWTGHPHLRIIDNR